MTPRLENSLDDEISINEFEREFIEASRKLIAASPSKKYKLITEKQLEEYKQALRELINFLEGTETSFGALEVLLIKNGISPDYYQQIKAVIDKARKLIDFKGK